MSISDTTKRLSASLDKVGESVDQVFVDMNSVFVEVDKVFADIGNKFETDVFEKNIVIETKGDTTVITKTTVIKKTSGVADFFDYFRRKSK